jgi:phage shock protein C
MEGRLTRSSTDKMIGGVCGGLGNYLGIDSTIIRLIFAFGIIFLGISPLVYILLWVFIPSDLSLRNQQQYTQRALPQAQQDPTGEWQYDPYTGEPLRRDETH